MKKIKVASLFSGIGGFEYGLEKALGKENIDIVFSSENNELAKKCYGILHHEIKNEDVRKAKEKDVPEHDLLVGGFPCQAFSSAGKGLGFLDTRGTLFFDLARIAKEKKPKAILLENVKGLLGHDKRRTLSVIINTLSEIGYRIDFSILNSADYGVAQLRERIIIVGIREDLAKNKESWGNQDSDIVNKTKKAIKKNYPEIKDFVFDFPKGEKDRVQVKDFLEKNPEEKYYQTDRKMTKMNKEELEKEIRKLVKRNRPNTEVGINFKENKDIRPHRLDPKKSGLSELNINYDENQVFTITSSHPPKIYGKTTDYRIRKLTPLECFRLQGFSDESFEKLKDAGVKDSGLYRLIGNAVTIEMIEAVVKKMKKEKYI